MTELDLRSLRPADLPGLDALLRALPVADDGPPLTVRDLIHSALRAGAIDDAATQAELGYLRPPPMFPDLTGLPTVSLPPPEEQLKQPLVELLEERRSSHHFGPDPLPISTLSTLLHHAAGVREHRPGYQSRRFPFRRAPSGGGLMPVDILIAANDVTGTAPGLYCYDPEPHRLARLDLGTMRGKLLEVTLYQEWLFHAQAVLLLALDLRRVEWKYGTRGYRYAHVDLGIQLQNLYLVGTALGLTTCAVAAFDDDATNGFARLDGRQRFVSLLFACGTPPTKAKAPSWSG